MSRLKNDLSMAAPRAALVVLTLATIVVRLFSASSVAADDPKRDQARTKIASMTDADRTRLKNDFEKFKALSDDQKHKLRQISLEVQRDPELKRTMQEYLDFLEPLSEGDRVELHSESDPATRAARVRTIMKEQQDRAEAWTRRSNGRRGLKPEDIDAVLNLALRHLHDEKLRPPERIAEVESKTGLARHVAIFELAFPRPSPGERTANPPFSEALLDDMAAAISDPVLRQRASKGNFLERLRSIIFLTYFGIQAEIRSATPSEEKLGEFLAKLPVAQQREITAMPVDQQQNALLRKYAEAHPDELARLPDVRWLFGDRQRGRRFNPGRSGESTGFRRPEAGSDENSGNPPASRRGPGERPRPDKTPREKPEK